MRIGRYIARVGDKVVGTCYAHPIPTRYVGTWTQGSGVVTAEGIGVIRAGDTGVTDCGHHIRAVEASGACSADGIMVHREGDAVEVIEGGVGITVSGSDYCCSF